MKQKLLLTTLAFISVTAFAQNRYWKAISNSEASKFTHGKTFFSDAFVPAAYSLFTLDEITFKKLIAKAPNEKNAFASASNCIISIPISENKTERFRLAEAPVMESQLAKKHPDIKSYSGQGLDDPHKFIRCDITPLGFHGMIVSADNNTIYINPVNKEANIYAVYARNENDKTTGTFQCELAASLPQSEKITANKTAPEGNADDGMLRQSRLALCCTGEYSRFFMTGSEITTQDSINTVMAAITTDLVRANQVFERDFGIRLVFVANEDTIIFLNPATDPFNNSNLNNACQSTCDKRIGNAGYDVGHVLHKGSDNGNAGCIACVCKTGSKGGGQTTYHDPSLVDYLVIDYWTHEMGHQFGANHTFTYYSEGTNAQIEPGSGSTIMGYAGITGSTDVQPHSDDYFNCASIAQVSNYFKTVAGGCAASRVTGNHAPKANGGQDRIIPMLTPFFLKGLGTDEDAGDALSYIWEQADALESGSNTFPKATSVKGPVFRSVKYSRSPVRFFPDEETIHSGATSNKWEALSSVSRDLNFRFTVWDNHAGAGNNASDDVLVQVTNLAGPFKVTAPNTRAALNARSVQTIKWDVANTNAAPVNCSAVKILLSIDGGRTYPIVLAANTPNDGRETVSIPNNLTTRARVAIRAIGNIFFDVSDVNFTIQAAAAISKSSQQNNSFYKWSVQPNPASDYTNVIFEEAIHDVSIILSGASGKIFYQKHFDSFNEGEMLKLSLDKLNKGIYFLKIFASEGVSVKKIMIE